MQTRGHHAVFPLAIALGGALLAAFAMMFAGGGRADALANCDVSHDALDGEEQAFLGLINAYRAQNGLGALTISTNLNRGAAWMAEDLATKAYFSHTDSLGRSAYLRAIDCGYPSGAGENLAAGTGWTSAQSAFTAWQNSPGHNSNMLGTYYQQIGIARFYLAGSPYGWYWSTTFGATDDGTGGGGGGGPTNTPAPTNTPLPTNTPRPTNTPLPTATPAVPTPAATQVVPTATPVTIAPTPSSTAAGGNTPAATPTKTPTPHGTPPVPTATPTQAAKATSTPLPSATASPTPSATSTPVRAASPTATPTGSVPSLALSPGANFVAWPGSNQPVEVALGDDPSVAVVYEWDAASRTWKRYFPDLPDYLNNLEMLRQGNVYWVIARSAAKLSID